MYGPVSTEIVFLTAIELGKALLDIENVVQKANHRYNVPLCIALKPNVCVLTL